MDDRTRRRLQEVKSRINAMLDERLTLQGRSAQTASPSQVWQDCSFWDYMRQLPEDAFEGLRLHTYHFTGDNYQRYLEGVGVNAFRADWEALVSTVPKEYWLREPTGGGMGFTCGDGRLVSMDVMRFQEVVNAFYHRGLFQELSRGPKKTVLEIGAGYGGLVHHLSQYVQGSFVIVDLPETLLFSAAYLTMNQPQKRVYVYDAGTFAEVLRAPRSYDFIFLPNYRLDDIRHLSFDLVLNVASMQEMRDDQVRAYIDFIHATLAGVFFSWNTDRHPRNAELKNLTEILESEFDATEIPTRELTSRKRRNIRGRLGRLLRSASRRLDPPLDAGHKMRYRMFVCRRRAD